MAPRLPDFVVIGAMRSGSTSLARYLGAHPQVFIAPEKEVRFFDEHVGRGLDWYRSRFAAAAPDQLAGEATPRYLASPEAMERMAEAVPGARLIVIARNPVDRAWSHYWMLRARDLEHRPFDVVLAEERALVAAEGPDAPRSNLLRHGFYAHHLRRVSRLFPREQLHVLTLEDLRARPAEAYAELCRFLGIADDVPLPEVVGRPLNAYVTFRSTRVRALARHLPGLAGRALTRLNTRRHESYPELDPVARRELAELFAGPNEELAEFLGRVPLEWAEPGHSRC